MDIFKKLILLEKEAEDFGFRWSNSKQIIEQIASEINEISEILDSNNTNHLKEEIGDLLHAAFSLCVHNKFDPKETLEKALDKFETRFSKVKKYTKKSGLDNLRDKDFEYCMKLWSKAKL